MRSKFEKTVELLLRGEAASFNDVSCNDGINVDKIGYEYTQIPYTLQSYYTPDFTLKFNNGDVLYVEAKGYLRPEDKRKHAALRKQYPGMKLCIIFQKLTGKDEKWCKKNEIDYYEIQSFKLAKAMGYTPRTGEVPLLERHIATLGLPKRAYYGLLRSGVKTISDLLGMTENDIMYQCGLGKVSLRSIKEKLNELSIALRPHSKDDANG